MGLSSSSLSDADQKLIQAIVDNDPVRLLKALKKGASLHKNMIPGRRASREARIPTLHAPVTPLWSPLMLASYLGVNSIVQLLLQQNAPVGLKASDGTTALMLAAQEGHLLVVEEILKHVRGGKSPHEQSGTVSTPPLVAPIGSPTHAAAGQATSSTTAAASSSSSSSSSSTSTVHERLAALSAKLLEPQPFTSFVTGDILPPVQPRSASSFDPILDAIDQKGQTALLKASALGFAPIVELLVYAGANVCIADQIDGMTALAWSSEHGPSEIVLLLIQAGANINRKNLNGQTPLHLAVSKTYDYSALSNMERQQMMMNGGTGGTGGLSGIDETSVHMEESKSSNIFSSSSIAPSAAAASSLGASSSSALPSSSISSASGASPLRPIWQTHMSSPTSVVRTLLENGADKDAVNHDKYSSLMVAAYRGHITVVELLLSFHANLNARAEKGQTALMLAAAQSNSRIAELIIKAGALLNTIDENGQSALHKAALSGDLFTTECLLDAGADIHAKEQHGNTALCLAARQMHGGIVDLLLKKGAHPDVSNHRGETPLMLASARGHSYTVGVLIRGGANINATDGLGNTPLLLASRAGSDSVVELLLDVGAILLHNHADEGPLHVALAAAMTSSLSSTLGSVHGVGSHAVVVELLVSAGADPITACAHLNVPSSVGPGGSVNGTSESVLHAMHPAIRDAVERGLSGRERFERRERRYGDLVQVVRRMKELGVGSTNGGTSGEEGVLRKPSVNRGYSGLASSSHTPELDTPTDHLAHSASLPRTASHAALTISTSQHHHVQASSALQRGVSDPADLSSSSLMQLNPSASSAALSLLPIREWSVAHVLTWLSSLSLPQYAAVFSDASVDGEMLLEFLREGGEDLLISELKMERKIHRMKVLREIRKLVIPGVVNEEGEMAQTPMANGMHHSAAGSAASSAQQTPISAVPLTTSISNPLPATTNGVPNGLARMPTAPTTNGAHPSSSPKIAAINGSVNKMNGSSSSSFSQQAASSSSAVPAPLLSLPTFQTTSTQGIFSGTFDFNDLSSLAPLSAANGSANNSNNTSKGTSPSGSADVLPNMSPATLNGTSSHANSTSALNGPTQPHRIPSIAEYTHMNENDFDATAASETNSSEAGTNYTNGNGNGNGTHQRRPTASPSLNALNASSTSIAPLPSSSPASSSATVARTRAPLPAARRIAFSDLSFKEVIGEGQFGTVYLGTWRGAAVAIKKLHLSSTLLLEQQAAESKSAQANGTSDALVTKPQAQRKEETEQITIFLQEAALMELLGNHPNLITFLGICIPTTMMDQEDDSASSSACADKSSNNKDVCIITQHFPLGSIRDLLITKKTYHKIPSTILSSIIMSSPPVLPAESASSGANTIDEGFSNVSFNLRTLLRMCRDIACGILHLHLDHVIHRDIAARNCLVDSFSLSIRVADFGLSRFLISQRQQSAYTQSHIGPLKWMSPESVLHHEYSEKSDTYSYGITVWEILCARDPYPSYLALEAAIAASHDESFRPIIPKSCPAPLSALMRDCWQHSPDARPSFSQILARIERMEAYLKERIDAWNTQHATALTQQNGHGSSASIEAQRYQWSEACWKDFKEEEVTPTAVTAKSTAASTATKKAAVNNL